MKFIMSDGFIKNKAFVKDLSFDGSGAIFDRCLFQVYPSFKSKYQTDLLEKFEDLAKNGGSTLKQARSYRTQQTNDVRV